MKSIDSIKNEFKKVKDEIKEQKISNTGVLDLRKYAVKIITLQEKNSKIKEEARFNVDIDLDQLENIFKTSDDLLKDMATTLNDINEVLDDKTAQINDYTAEIARQKDIINMYFDKINTYNAMIDDDQRILRKKKLDDDLEKLCNSELEFEEKKIEKLKELMEKHIDVCKEINVDINILRYGGESKKQKAKKAKDDNEVLDVKPTSTELDEALDNAFAQGLPVAEWDKVFTKGFTQDIWDSVFVNGTDEEVETEEVPEAAPVESVDEDADLAELVVPDLGDGPVKEAKEIIPVTVEEPVPAEVPAGEVEMPAPLQTEATPEVAPVVEEPVVETPVEAAPVAEPVADVVMPEPLPTEAAPVVEAPVEAAPVEVPAEEVVMPEPLPAEAAPVVETPVEAAPVAEPVADVVMPEPLPVEAAPVVETPVEAAPVAEPVADVVMPEPLPTEAAPVVEAPVETAPVAEPAPVVTEATDVEMPAPLETPAEGAPVDLDNQSLESAMSSFDWDKYFESTFDSNGQTLQK